MVKYVIAAMVVILSLTSVVRAQEPPDGIRRSESSPSEAVDNRGAAALQTSPAVPGAPAGAPNEAGKPSVRIALHELSPWSMYLSADALVKAVMISLAFASFVTWTIFLAKSVKLSIARWQLRRSLARISSAGSLSEAQLAIGRRRSVLSGFVTAAMQEIRRSGDISNESGIKERVASTFSEIRRVEARAVRHGMGVLATIGATAPFVGLFGTVWGIMNSFIGISKSQTTNLAVVAPGIAEALLATACGLAAAIPAVIIYNYLTRATRGYLDLVARASGAVGRLASRDVDRASGRTYPRAAE